MRIVALAVSVCLFVLSSTVVAEDAVDLAAQLIGRPYVWGAEGPKAFDCSGLTQYVYQKVGIALPRRAINQSTSGDPTRGALRRGDLLFFSTDARQSLVTHVGVYEGDGVMIDASKRHGRVRRDNLEDPFWVERFLFARRVQKGADDTLRVRTGRPDDTPSRSSGRRQAAVRVLETIAGELLKRPRNWSEIRCSLSGVSCWSSNSSISVASPTRRISSATPRPRPRPSSIRSVT